MKRVTTILTSLGSQVKLGLIALVATMLAMSAIGQQNTVHIKGKVYEQHNKSQDVTIRLSVLRDNDEFIQEWNTLDQNESVDSYDFMLSSSLEYKIEFIGRERTKILRILPGYTGFYQFNIDVTFVSPWSMIMMPKDEDTNTYHCRYMVFEDIQKI